MSYAAKADMVRCYSEAVLIDLTDRAGTGAIDDAVLNGALADADAEINTYLAGRYKLPLATVPSVLVGKACAIARYLLDGDNGNEIVRDRYRDAVAWLRSVTTGNASLGLDATQGEQTPAGGAEIKVGGRVFDRASRGLA